MGVRPDLQRGWSTQEYLFLSFLICEAKTGPTLKFFFMQISNIKSQCIKMGLGIRTVYMYMRWMDLELCTGDGCKTWPTTGLVHPAISLAELLDLWSKDWSYSHFFHASNSHYIKIGLGISTVYMFMCWMDLELCIGDGCKTWPTKGAGPPSNISSWASWSVKQRLVLLSLFFMQIFNSNSHYIKIGLGIRTVYMFMCWMDLELCTGDGCKTWPTKGVGPPSNISSWASWSVEQRLVLPSIFFCASFNTKSQCIKMCLGMRTVYMYMREMDLELCTGDGCKTWPPKGLVHPAKSLPELLDLWSKDVFYPRIFFMQIFNSECLCTKFFF